MNKSADNKICHDWYEKSYKKEGFKAQRLYPNEELLRFFGNNYFDLDKARRRQTKVLELGCGSGANLWMIARENFNAYGIDLSPEAIKLCREMLKRWKTSAKLDQGDFVNLPYQDNYFDCLADVLATYCLPWQSFQLCLEEINRVLKKGGKFFSYTLSANSDAFKNYYPAQKIDQYTLDGIKRKTSPYSGNNFPCRFITAADYRKILEQKGFKVVYLETVGRTYRQQKEYFEYVIIVGEKK